MNENVILSEKTCEHCGCRKYIIISFENNEEFCLKCSMNELVIVFTEISKAFNKFAKEIPLLIRNSIDNFEILKNKLNG